jgi:hypothetical protein
MWNNSGWTVNQAQHSGFAPAHAVSLNYSVLQSPASLLATSSFSRKTVLHTITTETVTVNVWSIAFTVTKFNKVFTGNQLCPVTAKKKKNILRAVLVIIRDLICLWNLGCPTHIQGKTKFMHELATVWFLLINISWKCYITYVLRCLCLETWNGVTLFSSVICHVVRCTQDTQCTSRLTCDQMIMEHTHTPTHTHTHTHNEYWDMLLSLVGHNSIINVDIHLNWLSGYDGGTRYALFLSPWVQCVHTSWLPFKPKKFKYPDALISHWARVSNMETYHLTG